MARSQPQWHYITENQQFGPISSGELQRLARTGAVAGNHLVRKEGTTEWVPARKVKGLIPQPTPSLTPHGEPPPLPRSTELNRTPPDAKAELESDAPPSRDYRLIATVAVGTAMYAMGFLSGWAATRQPTGSNPPPTLNRPVAVATPTPTEQPPVPTPQFQPTPSPPREPSRSVVDNPPPAQESITAETLVARFLMSNSGSRIAFGGKMLEVSGRVVDIRRDTANGVIVLLDGRTPFRQVVRCSVVSSQRDKAAKLNQGQSVVIRGRCDGHTTPESGVPGDTVVDVILGDCYVIGP